MNKHLPVPSGLDRSTDRKQLNQTGVPIARLLQIDARPIRQVVRRARTMKRTVASDYKLAPLLTTLHTSLSIQHEQNTQNVNQAALWTLIPSDLDWTMIEPTLFPFTCDLPTGNI
jgi:hypothetical protein